jgi:hypothetical protein
MGRRKSQKPGLDAVFADTAFWIGITRRSDQHHQRAIAWRAWLERSTPRVVTTEAVLWECLNGLSAADTRRQAVANYRLCTTSDLIEVVRFEATIADEAVALYEARMDKAWSATDCLSFLTMQRHNLSAALTTDHHFEQAGFRALLLEDPPS